MKKSAEIDCKPVELCPYYRRGRHEKNNDYVVVGTRACAAACFLLQKNVYPIVKNKTKLSKREGDGG